MYKHIRLAAYQANPDRGSFKVPLQTLVLPAEWEEPIRELYRHGMTPRQAERRKYIPTKAINQLMRAVAPDLVSVDQSATFGVGRPWLYAASPYPTPVINNFAAAWLRGLQQKPDDPESQRLLHQTFRLLETGNLAWQERPVDLLEQRVSDGGTSLPATHVYRLLADVLAARIANLDPYEHNGKRVEFRQVAGDADGGAELMSWPPEEYTSRNKAKDGSKIWRFSAFIKVKLRTTPFSPVPRIHLSAGIRRFVREQVWTPAEGGVSVYLLPNESLVPNAPTPTRFSVAMIEWDKKNRRPDWRHGGPEGMLLGVSALDRLPSIDRLVKEADHWIQGRDGIAVAVSHHTTMGRHAIGTGLMPAERRRLIEWAEQALALDFIPVPLLTRSRYSKPPKTQLEDRESIPTKEIPAEELAAIHAENEARNERNALRRRQNLAEALHGAPLNVAVLHQADGTRDRIIQAAEANLGLTEHRTIQGPRTWSWKSPELDITIHAQPLGLLGAPLGDGETPPKRGAEHDQAIADRRRAMAEFTKKIKETLPGAQVAIVELDGKDKFTKSKRRADPKHALRLGLADGGLVSQFIRPQDQELEPDEAQQDAAFRAEAAWHDALRQTGMRFVPQHTLGDAIPEQLNQLAFWLVKRRSDGPTNRPQFIPIAVLIRPGENCVMGKTADMASWVPYPKLLLSLTEKISDTDLRTKAEQTAATAAFVRKTLSKMRGTPTLVITRAQNIRERWPWLKNGELYQDKISFDAGPLTRIDIIGRQLRIFRIADGARDETPESWAPAELANDKHAGKQLAGISKGLWVRDDTDRTFYSTADKPGTHQITLEAAKLTPHVNGKGNSEYKPTKNAYNPDLLELTAACLQPDDEPEAWAMYIHQQRFCDDYRDVLGLPLILHLAKLADHYALPQEDVETLAVPEHEGPEQLSLELEAESAPY